MGETNFNRRQCIRSLIKIGFHLCNDRHGIHDKYCAPVHYTGAFQIDKRPFIMIPRHAELRLQHKIIHELKQIGGDELVQRFKSYL